VRYFPPSELVLNGEGAVYHLGLTPKDIAHKIILVGDQDRVGMVSSFFEHVEHRSQHREFVCHSGTYKGKRISALSSGIGTDNIDITMNELDALVNIDFEERKQLSSHTSLEIIRIGTCGLLQPDIPLHAYVLSTHAFGLDNIAHFYEIPFTDDEEKLNEHICKHLGLPSGIHPYLCASDERLDQKLIGPNVHQGITVTSSGFYGPQGRQLRIPNRVKDLNGLLSSFNSTGKKVTNFEMESSALFSLGRALGHACATICLGVANRPNMAFSKGYEKEMNGLIHYVLERF
jgi:uridine phosphorylase